MIKPNGGGVISLLNYVEQNGEELFSETRFKCSA